MEKRVRGIGLAFSFLGLGSVLRSLVCFIHVCAHHSVSGSSILND
jgi:hypothetical protein